MANEAKIRIPIDIPPGDVSGAEVARREIEATAQTAERANTQESSRLKQQQAEVSRASRQASERRVKEATDALIAEKEAERAAKDSAVARTAALAAVALTAREALQVTREALADYKKLGVELTPTAQAFADTLDLLANPVDTLIDKLTGYKDELKLLQEGQARVAESEKQYLATLKAANEERARAARSRIDNEMSQELAIIDEQTRAYENQLKVIKAVAQAEEARVRASEAIGIANGSLDPNTVAANQAARQAARDSAEADQEVVNAAQKVKELRDKVFILTGAIDQAQQDGLGDRAQQLKDELAGINEKLGAAEDTVATLEQTAAAAKAEIASKAVAEQQGVVDATGTALVDAAKNAKDTLEAAANEQGRELTAGGKEALRILTDALKDGIVTPQEMQAVAVAIEQVKNSRDAADAEIMKAFTELAKANAAATGALQKLTAGFANQAAELENLKGRLAAAGL